MKHEWSKEERWVALNQLLNGTVHMTGCISLQCQVNLLRDVLQYLYNSARELDGCECFELGAIQQAKKALDITEPEVA